MERKKQDRKAKAGSPREERLKAALKANMARRKAQARARAAGETEGESGGDTGRFGASDKDEG